MKKRFWLSYFLSSFALLSPALSSAQNAQEFSEILDERDIEALRDWIRTKRQVTVKELGGHLSISGEVRTELQSTSEKRNGIKQRGVGGAVPGTPSRAYDIEVNLMFDYRTERTWATIKLEFDNNAGTVTGTFNRLALERAFLGARIMDTDTYTVDLEFGRRRFNYTFDSRIEFNSFMDGIIFRYGNAFDFLGDLYVIAGPYLINELRDQYGYVGEIGLLNIFNTGLYTKYSYINWDTKHYPNPLQRDSFRFRISQWILGYKFVPQWLGKIITFYSAWLVNHAAQPIAITKFKKRNLGAYIGFSAGELRKKGDWSMDLNYQWVQAQAIPDFDVSGIGRGNAARVGFYSTGPFGTGNPTTRATAVGSTNYRGFSLEVLYLFANNLTLYQGWIQSVNQDKSIGPFIRYKQYEMELIYTF